MRGFHTVVKLVCHAIHSFFAFVFTKVTCVFSTQLLWWGKVQFNLAYFITFLLAWGAKCGRYVCNWNKILRLNHHTGKNYPCDQAYFLRVIQTTNGQFQNMTD